MIIVPSNVGGGAGEPSEIIATITGVGTNPGGSNGLSIFPYNGYVYVGSEGEIAVIDPATNTVVNKFTSAGSFLPGKFFVHPVSGQLYVGGMFSYGGAGSVYTVNGISSVTLKRNSGSPQACAFNANGNALLLLTNTSYYVGWWDTSTSTWSGSSVPGGAYNPTNVVRANNKFYYYGNVADASGFVAGLVSYDNNFSYQGSIFNATQPPYWSVTYGLCASNDGSKVYFGDSRNDMLRTASTTANTITSVKTFENGTDSYVGPISIAVSPSGAEWNRIYVLRANGTLKILDGSTQDVIATISGLSATARGICVSPVNNCIYVANYSDNTVSVIG